jgi:DNA-binding transcriptional ArsR family regulator
VTRERRPSASKRSSRSAAAAATRDGNDEIWKALADATRREILDFVRDGPRTTTEIVERLPHLSRFGVMKHMEVLREAGLLITRREGRSVVNSLNATPIRQIAERWISKYAAVWANSLLRIKESVERKPPET